MIRFLETNWLWITFVVVMLTMHRHGGCGMHGHHHGDQHDQHQGEQPPREVEHAHHGGHGKEAS